MSPDRGNHTPSRDKVGVITRLVEVLGAKRFLTQVNCRKALGVGKSARIDNARYLSVVPRVVAEGLFRNTANLPMAFLGVPAILLVGRGSHRPRPMALKSKDHDTVPKGCLTAAPTPFWREGRL